MISGMDATLSTSAATTFSCRAASSHLRIGSIVMDKIKAVLCHHRMLTHRGIGHCILRTLAHAKTKKGISNREKAHLVAPCGVKKKNKKSILF
jgi:hypothetical protein